MQRGKCRLGFDGEKFTLSSHFTAFTPLLHPARILITSCFSVKTISEVACWSFTWQIQTQNSKGLPFHWISCNNNKI